MAGFHLCLRTRTVSSLLKVEKVQYTPRFNSWRYGEMNTNRTSFSDHQSSKPNNTSNTYTNSTAYVFLFFFQLIFCFIKAKGREETVFCNCCLDLCLPRFVFDPAISNWQQIVDLKIASINKSIVGCNNQKLQRNLNTCPTTKEGMYLIQGIAL